MKRLTAILLVTVFMVTFLAGCGRNDRELYGSVDLANYVELENYLDIEIDTSSDEFTEYYNKIFNNDIADYGLYKELKEGTVADGDIVNLDYEGKIDGVAFEGGTAQGYDLTIGSGTFIDDFEEELIGVAVGETKDVTAKFPENYGKDDLNGKEAIFTCKINYIKKAMTPEEAYSTREFDSAEDYIEDIKKRAIESNIIEILSSKAKIKDFPQADSDKLCDAFYELYKDIYKTQYNVNIEELLAQSNMTVEVYKEQLATEMVIPMMKVNMLMYYIFDTENLELLDSTLESQPIDNAVIAESYAVQDTVINFLFDNIKIK